MGKRDTVKIFGRQKQTAARYESLSQKAFNEPTDKPQGMSAGFKEYNNRSPIQKSTAKAVKP
jgi:hypothetical protein